MALDFVYKRDFRPTLTGQVKELIGASNVRSALQNRLATFPGSIPFRPSYGANLKAYQNMPLSAKNRDQIVQDVQEQILRDPRVQSIRKVDVRTTEAGLISISVGILLQGSNEPQNVEVVT